MKPSVLLLGKANDFYCDAAVEFVKLHFPNHTICLGARGDQFPDAGNNWKGDYIISYLSPWIVPAAVLNCANTASLNFHPGPPEYPGIGCTNFAIYDGVDTIGVTCHHMDPTVDTGKLVAVRRFPLYESDTVYSLTKRCYGYILQLFYEIASVILGDGELPSLDENWTRKPYKRSELNDLCRITPEMSEEEIKRRVRAVTFPNAPGAFMEVDGVKVDFKLQE